MVNADGGCLCGAQRYRLHGRPARVTICHCRFCQRATGGAYMVEPIFDKSKFKILKGAPKIYEHQSEGSGKQVYVNFCPNCGTKLFLTFERFTDVVGVYGGTFDNPNWYERTAENTKQIFLGVAQNGSVILPGINTFDEHASTTDGTPIPPQIYSEPKIIGST